MINNAKRIVVKVGSSLSIGQDNLPRTAWMAALAEDVLTLRNSGKELVVVSSGAVARGRQALGYGTRLLELEEKQAAAACGQITLISQWAAAFQSAATAQILLTADDSINRRRYLNARNTIEILLERGAIPIINENDVVATEELRFGDNDRLAARVAQMIGAELLILFSDVDGLYSANPLTHPNAQFQEKVEAITPDIEAMAGGAGSHVGTGGMVTKIAAAKIAVAAGCHMMIARGTELHPLKALMQGGKCTLFVAKENPLSARKKWISSSLHLSGVVRIDDGAATALRSGKSLLPAGVRAVEGEFERGDAISVCDLQGRLIGKGLSAYSATDARAIAGHKSEEIEEILGFKGRNALIHRDDLVLE